MVSVGSASIELQLDRSEFDNDIQSLEQQKIAPFLTRLRIDAKDFERQIKGLHGFIPAIDIPVSINIQSAVVNRQFTEIGRHAAAGFAQGFSGAEGAGKVAIESMVKSVKSQLGIASPSRVFRDIGKHAADGLVQGLQTVEVRQVVAKINTEFAGVKIKAGVGLNPDVEDFKKKLAGLSGSVDVKLAGSSSPGETIAKSIEDGFKKVKPQSGFLSSIFGGIGSLITAPIAGAFRGAFEGVGAPIGRQVGSGVAKAIQSTLGSEIGSLELISQRAVEKSLSAIPKATESIVEAIKANPIGNAVTKQLESLQRTLELYRINLSPKQAIKSLASDSERAIASSSAAFTSQEQDFKSTKKARAAASNEFVSLVSKQGDVDKITQIIQQKEQDLVAKVKKLQVAQQAIASLEIQLQKISQLPTNQRAAAEKSINSKIAEFSEILAGGSASIEQDTKDIADLKETKTAYFEKLNSQIKILAELGIESDLSSQSAEILKGIEVFEQMVAAQKALASAQVSVKTNAKTPESIRGKKLEKLTLRATTSKTELDKAIASPDATPDQVQRLQKRSASANKALDLYKLELANPAKEIEALNKKLENGNAKLAQNIQELQNRLNEAIPRLFRDASQEVVRVSNLSEIPQPQPLPQQQAAPPLKAQAPVSDPLLEVQTPATVPTTQAQSPEVVPALVSKPKAKIGQSSYDAWDLGSQEYQKSLSLEVSQKKLSQTFKGLKIDQYMMKTPQGLLDIQKQGQLSDAEIKVLQAYTQGPYRFINAYLRESRSGLEKELKRIQDASGKLGAEKVNQLYGGDYNLPIDELEQYVSTLAQTLQSILPKLPDFKGVVFRGEGAKEELASIQQRLSEGEIKSAAFTSSGITEGFAGKAQYAIKSNSGKMIQIPGAQGVDKAGEVLHNQGQRFKIVAQQPADSELSIPSSFDLPEAQLIKQTLTPEKLKELGAEVVVFLEEIDTAAEESIAAIKESLPEMKPEADYGAWDLNKPSFKEALETDNLTRAYTRGRKLAPQLSKKYGLTADEEAALAVYTATGLFDAINSYLRGGTEGLKKAVDKAKARIAEKRQSGLSEEEIQRRLLTDFPVEEGLEQRIQVYAETLSSALAKIPASQKHDLVFRGEGSIPRVENYLPGSEHNFPAFTSVSEKDPFSTPAQLVIFPKSAKDITPFAPLANIGKELGGASFGSELALDRNTRTRVIGRKELSPLEKTGQAPLDLSGIEGLTKEQLQKIQSQYTPEFIKNSGTEVIVILEEIQKEVASVLEGATEAIASVQQELKPVVEEFLNLPKPDLPAPTSNPEISFSSSDDVRSFISQNLNAKGVKDLARRMGIDTKNANKEYLINELSSFGGTTDSRLQLAQLASQLTPDKFLSASKTKGKTSPLPEAQKAIAELKKARKELAETLDLVQELEGEDRRIVLESIVDAAREQEAIAKSLGSEYQLTPAQSKSLGGTKTQLKNISDQAKISLADLDESETGEKLGTNLIEAVGSGITASVPIPVKEVEKAMAAIEVAAKDQAEIKSPSRVFQRIGKFLSEGLALGIKEGGKLAKAAIASVLTGVKDAARTTSPLPVPPPPPGMQGKALVPYESKLPAIPKLPVPQQVTSTASTALVPVPPKPPFSIPPSPKSDDKSVPPIPSSPKPSTKSVLPIPPSPAQVDPKFGLPIKLQQLFNKVIDSGELLKVVADIQKDQAKSLNQKLLEYDQIVQIYEDLEKEREKQNQELDAKFSPEKVEQQRQGVRDKAKLSATLERKYGLEGLAPELVPDAIKEGDTGKSPSLVQGIKDIFKSLDNSLAARIKKRAATLAVEVDTAIAPSLETAAIGAKAEGRTSDEKQFTKLARQARAATKGIGNLLGKDELADKEIKRLNALTEQLEKVYDAIGRPLPSQGLLESFGIGLSGLAKNLGNFVKGAAAFAATSFLQNIFRDLAKQSFLAYVELDKLKTALNFGSGGSSGGAQNLAFVRKQVEELKVPLKASIEGFSQLASAARGSALQGQGTRELFLGISQASTVLSLSADETKGAILALSQMISKGKVSAEELRGQLGERIPGALGIAARAMGVTEQEFSRLLDTGSILSQDFLPKFAKQLQAEFGDAAKDAAGNAQGAIFDLQNSFLSLQQGIGEGVSPAAIAGLNIFSIILKGLSAIAKELGFVLLGVTVALSIKMVAALKAVIAELIATKLATGTLSGGFQALGKSINNSFSVKLTTAIFGVLEIINLLNQAINTDLVQSFEKAAASAKRAAEESRKAFEKPAPGKTNSLEPVASSGVGRFLDKYLIGFLNMDVGPLKGGMPFTDTKLSTYGELEQARINQSVTDITGGNADFLSSARTRLSQLKADKGEIGKLPALDSTLRDAEMQRQILQANIKRNFTDKGLATPSQERRRLEAQNIRIAELNNQRSDIAKPFTRDISRTDQQINSIRSQIEALKNPDNIAAAGGGEAAMQLTDQLNASLEELKKFKADAEAALASLKVDPVLAFTNALRKLNLAFTESQEKNEQKFNQERAAIANNQLAGFSRNTLASRNAALQNAISERDRNSANVMALQKAVDASDKTINAPEFQATLKRLGVTPDATVAKIDDVLKNTQDEADKGILEKLKATREQRNKLSESRAGLAESNLKAKQVTQDNSLFSVDESAAKSRARIQKSENQAIAGVRSAQEARVLVEEVANEKIARIQLKSTQRQQKSVGEQLATLRTYYKQSRISAEEFARRERELTLEQTNLEKQEAENRIGVQSATLQRRLKEIETANRQAELAIGINQSKGGAEIKSRLLASGITPTGQDRAALDQNAVDQKAARDRIASIKTRMAQNEQLYKDGLRNNRDRATEELSLNQELAQSYSQLIDLKIAQEEKYRAVLERNINTRQTQETTAIKERLLAAGLNPEAQDAAALEQNAVEQKAVSDRIALIRSRVKDEKAAAAEIAPLQQQLVDLQIAEEERRRDNTERAIGRIVQAEENRHRTLTSQLDEQKAALDLYNQSLDRTAKLEESRFNLNKALSDAAISPLEINRDNASRALELSRKLKDENLDPGVRSVVKSQLSALGFGTDEIRILEKRSQIEDEIAAKKLEALKTEQAYQKQSLELDLKRQRIAAQTAVYDAQSAQLSAAKSKLDAESALRIAAIRQDDVAIQSAKVGIEIADREIALGDKRLANALENLAIQDELTQNATKAQEATQKMALEQQAAADSARKQGAALEKAEAKASKSSGNSQSSESRNRNYDLTASNPQLASFSASASRNNRSSRRPGRIGETFAENGRTIQDGVDVTNYSYDESLNRADLQLPKRIEINQLPNLSLKPGESAFEAYQRYRESMVSDKTAQAVDAAKIKPSIGDNFSRFTDAIKAANQEVVQRLDRLIESSQAIARSPRSLTVQSPNPVDDAAKLMNDLYRGQMMGAGL